MVELDGKKVFVAGRFHALHQDGLKARLRARGAEVQRKLTDATELVVLGERVKEDVLRAVAARDLSTVDERAVLPLVGIDDVNTRLTRLREVAHGSPSAEAWETLCAHLDDWPRGDLPLALDYLEPLLAGWPEELRVAPERWLVADTRPRDERMLLARVAEPEGAWAGYLVVVAESPTRDQEAALIEESEGRPPRRDPPTLHGPGIERTRETLRLVGEDGATLAQRSLSPPPYAWCTQSALRSRDGRYVWLLGYDGEAEAGAVWLLDGANLDVVDVYGGLDVWMEAGGVWSPDGTTLAMLNNAGDSCLGVHTFAERDGRIEGRVVPDVPYRTSDLIGFSRCGRRLAALDSDGQLFLWRWPELSRLPAAWIPTPDEESACPTWGGHFGPRFLVIPLRGFDRWTEAFGVCLLDPLTGEYLGRVRSPLGSTWGDRLEVLSERVVLREGGRTQLMRLLPDRRLLSRPDGSQTSP